VAQGGGPVLAIAATVVGIPLWFGWEYARPTWTTGVSTGTEVRRTDPDARGNTTDFEYIYMRNRSDRGLELTNDDSWLWLKRNSERVFNDPKTSQSRNTEVTVMWNRWRSTLFTWFPNVIAIGPCVYRKPHPHSLAGERPDPVRVISSICQQHGSWLQFVRERRT
jgi:hypothetical protein